MENQLSIFDFLNMDVKLSYAKTRKDSIINSAEDYLQKGERLLTIAKEQFRSATAGIDFSFFEEQLYASKLTGTDSDVSVVQKCIRKCMRKSEVPEDDIMRGVLSKISYNVSLEKADYAEYSRRGRSVYSQFEGDTVWRLTLNEVGYPVLVVLGTKNKSHSKATNDRLYTDGVAVADIAEILAYLLIFSLGMKNVKFENHIPASASTIVELHGIKRVYRASNPRFTSEQWITECQNPWESPWVIPNGERYDFEHTFKELFDELGVHYEYAPSDFRTLSKNLDEDIHNGIYPSPKSIPYIFNRTNEAGIRNIFCYRAKDTWDMYGTIPYHLVLLNKDGQYDMFWAMPKWWRSCNTALISLLIKGFNDAVKVKHNELVTVKHLKNLESEHARSFQTKKNIPVATIKAMKDSIFNDYFGYVEYDEDVDLNKVAVIADEWVAFKETYFKTIDATGNAIRFRRLGNHKASGLYYPSVKCLCVDIHSPSTLIHEFGHLIDYCYGNLSAKTEFLSLSELYENRVRQAMKDCEDFGKKMNGGGKYNLSYYLTPTEIFARSFELYCVKTLGVKNSLTPDCFGLPYPQDTEFLNVVNEYFEVTLKTLVPDTNNELLKVASV